VRVVFGTSEHVSGILLCRSLGPVGDEIPVQGLQKRRETLLRSGINPSFIHTYISMMECARLECRIVHGDSRGWLRTPHWSVAAKLTRWIRQCVFEGNYTPTVLDPWCRSTSSHSPNAAMLTNPLARAWAALRDAAIFVPARAS
jgi:hypothetical protein